MLQCCVIPSESQIEPTQALIDDSNKQEHISSPQVTVPLKRRRLLTDKAELIHERGEGWLAVSRLWKKKGHIEGHHE